MTMLCGSAKIYENEIQTASNSHLQVGLPIKKRSISHILHQVCRVFYNKNSVAIVFKDFTIIALLSLHKLH